MCKICFARLLRRPAAADNVLRSRDASCRPTPVENVPLDPVPIGDGPCPQDLQVSRGQCPPAAPGLTAIFLSQLEPLSGASVWADRSAQDSSPTARADSAAPAGDYRPRTDLGRRNEASSCPWSCAKPNAALLRGFHTQNRAKSELLRGRRGAPRSEFSRK